MVASVEKPVEYLCRHVMPQSQALSKGREKIENNSVVKSEPQQPSLLQSNKHIKLEE